MNVYKEIKEIAKCVSKINSLIEKINKENGEIAEGLDWYTAEFVTLTKEDIKHFKDRHCETEDYYVDQHTGYCEDDFYGHVYFKTDVPAQYIKIHFFC